MSYRNKTYVIFDGDTDIGMYGFMKGWKINDNVDFDFYDAHDIRPLRDGSNEDTVKRALRERMKSAKHAIVLVGKNTKNLFRFVRWEIDLAMSNDLPIVVVNLSGLRQIDNELCPPILRKHTAVHVAFRMKIIKTALDGFSPWYVSAPATEKTGPRHYNDAAYKELGL